MPPSFALTLLLFCSCCCCSTCGAFPVLLRPWMDHSFLFLLSFLLLFLLRLGMFWCWWCWWNVGWMMGAFFGSGSGVGGGSYPPPPPFRAKPPRPPPPRHWRRCAFLRVWGGDVTSLRPGWSVWSGSVGEGAAAAAAAARPLCWCRLELFVLCRVLAANAGRFHKTVFIFFYKHNCQRFA